MARRLASMPTESIPNSCQGGETQAAYRFVANRRASWHSVLEPHWSCSGPCMRDHAVVLKIQVTTELNFNGGASQALGRLSYGVLRGMYFLRPARRRRSTTRGSA